jgi:organic radical activating enzyme
MNKKIFPIQTETGCLLKWAWSTIYLGQGKTASCHRVDQHFIDPNNVGNFHNQPEKILARELMLDGKWPGKGCEYCKKIEDVGGMSDRIHQLEQLKNNNSWEMIPQGLLDNPRATHVVPTILEIYFNNTCNMSCLYCGSHFSSKWEEENRRFGEYRSERLYFGYNLPQNPNYEQMLADFWTWLEKDNNYLHIRQYQIAGGEPFYQKEFDQSIEFWEQHPNPNLTFNMITNLKVAPKKFRSYIDKFGDMVRSGNLKQLQISSSLDCWGPQQEYVRQGLDLTEWQENFEYLLDKPWVQQCINSAVSALTIKTLPDLIKNIIQWNTQAQGIKEVYYSFMSIMYPKQMDPAIFGAGVFDDDFAQVLDLMDQIPSPSDSVRASRTHMQGIAQQITQAPRDLNSIESLKEYLTELDRRRNTNWRSLFPWLDQDWR